MIKEFLDGFMRGYINTKESIYSKSDKDNLCCNRQLVLHFLSHFLGNPRMIFDREGENPYLSRYYITSGPTMPDGSHPFNEDGNPKEGAVWPLEKKGIGLYLHRFHRGDDDLELHNHPWAWSVSLILWGGYREENRDKGWRTFLPGSINVIRHSTYHRVELIKDEAWTLFLSGPRVASWGFWNPITGETTPWRNFINKKRDITSFTRFKDERQSKN